MEMTYVLCLPIGNMNRIVNIYIYIGQASQGSVFYDQGIF